MKKKNVWKSWECLLPTDGETSLYDLVQATFAHVEAGYRGKALGRARRGLALGIIAEEYRIMHPEVIVDPGAFVSPTGPKEA